LQVRNLTSSLLWILLLPALAAARQAPADPAASCEAGRIAQVDIRNGSIFEQAAAARPDRLGLAYRTANSLHMRTRAYVVRRQLLFSAGDCLDLLLLRESERLLRELELFSHVDITALPQPDGSYDVRVETRDDWSTRADVRMHVENGIAFHGGSLYEYNLLGTGQTLGAHFTDRGVDRGWGISYAAPQFMTSRWQLTVDAGRTHAGLFADQEITHPFVSEVSRWAARQRFSRDDRYFEFVTAAPATEARDRVLLPLRENVFDLTLVRRIGQKGSTTLLGTAISHQALSFPGSAIFVPGGRFEERAGSDSADARVLPQTAALASLRVFGIVGQRNIVWTKRTGLDAMRGEQDLAIGLDAVLAVGRSMAGLEAGDDLSTMISVYTGVEAGGAVVVGNARVDARRNHRAPATAPEWEDIAMEAELLAYFQTRQLGGHTLLLRAAGLGAWETRRPFQLTLGGDRALRGIAPDRLPGGRRLVFTLEDRVHFGWPLPDLADLGGTIFADVGRVWPGDAPWGIDSGWRASAGIGLRAGFPAGSRANQRLDLAWPIGHGAQLRDFRLTFSIREVIGISDRTGDFQFRRSRPDGVLGNLRNLTR
jgi:hypothetical protein